MVELKDLHVKGEDFFFDGDLRLLGKSIIEDGSLTVTGNLILAETYDSSEKLVSPSLEVTNGNLTAGNLWTESDNGSSIAYDECICKKFSVNGDIHITSGDLNLGMSDIEETGDIIVEGDLICNNIKSAFSIYVSGSIDCNDITTIFDIFCEDHAEIQGNTICGGDLYTEDYYDCHGNDISIKGSLSAYLYETGRIEVG